MDAEFCQFHSPFILLLRMQFNTGSFWLSCLNWWEFSKTANKWMQRNYVNRGLSWKLPLFHSLLCTKRAFDQQMAVCRSEMGAVRVHTMSNGACSCAIQNAPFAHCPVNDSDRSTKPFFSSSLFVFHFTNAVATNHEWMNEMKLNDTLLICAHRLHDRRASQALAL